jgi:N-acetylmuramoyl-L-alanine amidase
MSTGKAVVELALRHLGEDYVLGAFVPKDDPSWDGPWDCAEFVSWCVYQTARILYGCSNSTTPATADAWTGFWARDAEERGKKISVAEAARTPGAAVLRVGAGTKVGHIVISDGKGGTVEAHSRNTGVIRSTLKDRRWDMGILVPGITYEAGAEVITVPPPPKIYRLTQPYSEGEEIKKIQKALRDLGFNPGEVDGVFGPKTFGAVLAFQQDRGLLPDGEVGPQTAKALGISF